MWWVELVMQSPSRTSHITFMRLFLQGNGELDTLPSLFTLDDAK